MSTLPALVQVTFPDCSHSMELMRGRTLPEDCPSCEMGVGELVNGRCEDYPCCGHTDGPCGYDPRGTSDYWREVASQAYADEHFSWDDYDEE